MGQAEILRALEKNKDWADARRIMQLTGRASTSVFRSLKVLYKNNEIERKIIPIGNGQWRASIWRAKDV